MVDTNILLSATDEGRPSHLRARAVLDEWPSHGTTLYTSGQILREYVAVATRPLQVNGLAMPTADVLANVAAFTGRMRLLAEDERVHGRLMRLLGEVACSGKQVHDANVVATMLVGGATRLVTENVADFAPFGDLVAVVEP